MPTKDDVRALLERYCAAMNSGDRERWLDCFADDAVREDPVGSPPNRGRAELAAAFDANHIPVTLTVSDDPLIAGGEVLAFFTVDAEMDGTTMRLPRIVDHILLTADGTRFQSLRAFFDYAELVPVTE